MTNSAVLSDDGLHRFRLDRQIGTGQIKFMFIGVNPSTADATVNDQTVKKWVGFSSQWGAEKFSVANLFTWRATDVKQLNKYHEINREFHSDFHMKMMLSESDVIVPCWGRRDKIADRHRSRIDVVKKMILEVNKPVKCFGLTKNGDPKHPLMLPYSTELMDFA